MIKRKGLGVNTILRRKKNSKMDSITEDGVAGKYENELRKRI